MLFLLALLTTLALGALIAYAIAHPDPGVVPPESSGSPAPAAYAATAPPVAVLISASSTPLWVPAAAPVARASSVRWWMLLHHGVVWLGAAATVLALLLPPGLFGGQQQAGLWGGFLGHFAALGFFWVLAAWALTLLLRQVPHRVSTQRAQAAAVGGIWALTLLLGAAVAIIVLT